MIPAAVLLRAWWTSSFDTSQLFVFGAVAMVFTLAFLGAGRAVATLLVPRLRPATR
jgi:hypothetical protein